VERSAVNQLLFVVLGTQRVHAQERKRPHHTGSAKPEVE
jgi:hypothetical protein